MTRSFARLAWSAAAATYLLIVLGAIVRITSSGMGCGDHWPPWTVVLHLGTAMLLLATLLVAALGPRPAPPSRAGLRAAALGFVTVLLGALTANTGASSACFGFPLCNGQLVPDGTYLQYIHWTHRLLAYALFGYTLWWASRTRRRAAWSVLGLVILQIAVAAAMVLL